VITRNKVSGRDPSSGSFPAPRKADYFGLPFPLFPFACPLFPFPLACPLFPFPFACPLFPFPFFLSPTALAPWMLPMSLPWLTLP
jgi:hypothetical protein